MKKVLFKIYIFLDFFILLSSIILFLLFLSSFITYSLELIFFIIVGAYISINSIVGIIWAKKNKELTDFFISNNWLLPIYIVNVLSVFCLLLPLGLLFHSLASKDYIIFIFCFYISLVIILTILGQVKWQKMVISNQNLKQFIKYYICISNPIKCFFIILILQAHILPTIWFTFTKKKIWNIF